MATKRTTTPPPSPAPTRPPYMLIEQIQVKGYKSLVDATLHVRPLTLLAGTNSSGKSSIMQPLLLIKQTMEAPYQPAGALVLGGAHVQAETARELVSKVEKSAMGFQLAVVGQEGEKKSLMQTAFIELQYQLDGHAFKIAKQKAGKGGKEVELFPTQAWVAVKQQLITQSLLTKQSSDSNKGIVESINGFLRIYFLSQSGTILANASASSALESSLSSLMHIPGLRGSPQRTYAVTTFQNQIRGTFDLYAAGTISQWQQQSNTGALAQLNDSLQRLGLTNSVTAKVKNANEVELSVNRLPAASKAKPRKADMVNIADVGIGVSQVLPILVALIAAQEGQIVYVEQPELHLHPRAQVVMGELLAEAANRGVRVIVETHSSLLLLTVQTLVAEGKIKPGDVGLHWFERDAKGATTVRYEQPDENGAYGEWPEDFGDVELTAQRNYLDAVTRRQPKRSAKA